MTINGSDLMVFVTVEGGLKSIAFATSHQLNITMNTKDTSTKDNGNGIWQNFEAGLMGWTMQSDNLMSDSAENGASMNDLVDIMIKHEPVEVVFSLQTNNLDYAGKLNDEFKAPEGGWTPDSANQLHGKAMITSLTVNAPNGEKATATVQFTGCGNLQKLGKGLQKATVRATSSKEVAPVPTTSK